MKGYLTKRPNGLFCLTRSYPVIARVGTSQDMDVFIPPGDGFGQHRIPSSCVSAIWSREIAAELVPLLPVVSMLSDKTGPDIYLGRRGKPYGELCFIAKYQPVSFDIDGQSELGPVAEDPVYCNVFCLWFALGVWGFVPEPCEYKSVKLSGRIRKVA